MALDDVQVLVAYTLVMSMFGGLLIGLDWAQNKLDRQRQPNNRRLH